MDQNRPPHLPRRRPASAPGVIIDGDAEPVAAEQGATPDIDAITESNATDAPDAPIVPDDQPREPDPAPQAGPQAATPPRSDEPAKTPAPRRSSSLVAGAVGAVLALGGTYGLQLAGVLPSPDGSDARIVALEGRIAALDTDDAGQMEAELAALKNSVSALSQNASTQNTLPETLESRLGAMEQELAALREAAAGGVDPAVLSRLAAVESGLSALSADNGAEALRNGLNAEIAALKAQMADMSAQIAARADDPGLAAAVAATALRAAVERGGPFAAELETLAALQPDLPAVTALRNFAAAGVPTRAEILSGFEDAAALMLAADAPVDPDATFLDRLMNSAQGLVRTRPVGVVEGDSTGARIARMGEAIRAGNDAAAQAEFAALPAPVRAAGDAYMARLSARAETDRLIAEAIRAATASGPASGTNTGQGG